MNYGGILQAYALQTVLKRQGHEVFTIDHHNRREYSSFKSQLLSFLKRNFLHYFRKEDVSICWNPFMSENEYKMLSHNTRDFVARNLSMTREIWRDDIYSIDKEYLFDAYVVGSDQVWLPYYYPNSFLDFVDKKGVIKVFYGASCGEYSFLNNPLAIKTCQSLLEDFTGISVREDSLIKRVDHTIHRPIEHVLDPTLLLEPEDYISVCSCESRISDNIFVYILDDNENKQRIVDFVNKELVLPIRNVNASKKFIKRSNTNIKECVFPSVDNWILSLEKSSFVVTDSFHGTVFSILFNKPFVVIGNKQRGMDRFISLLSIFDLSDRLISDGDLNKLNMLINKKIDYRLVNERLETWRNKSLKFLENSLNS